MSQTKTILKTGDKEVQKIDKFPTFIAALNQVMKLSANEIANVKIDSFIKETFDKVYDNNEENIKCLNK